MIAMVTQWFARAQKQEPRQQSQWLQLHVPKKDGWKLAGEEPGVYVWQKNSGLTTPKNHILSYCYNNNKQQMYEDYWDLNDQKQGGTLLAMGFTKLPSFTPTEDAMYDWINLILEENLLRSVLENLNFCIQACLSNFPEALQEWSLQRG